MPNGYHHLAYEQRCQIYVLKKRGDSSRAIATILGVHRSTIHRELDRNAGKRGYRHKQAQTLASKRRHDADSKLKKMSPEIALLIKSKLEIQWSPEQISGWMKLQREATSVSYETIYRHIWHNKSRGGKLYLNLRHQGKKYNKRGGKNAGRGLIPQRIDIDQRPPIVEEKSRLGDWEVDTIVGKNHQGAIVSLVERSSKLTLLSILPDRKASRVATQITKRLEPIKECVLTITSDNGKEFAGHVSISKQLEANFFFAKPYRSWERGLNEHTNGLVRQYCPKKTSFKHLTQKHMLKIENLLNNRPRKVLNFRTPIEVFNQMRSAGQSVALRC